MILLYLTKAVIKFDSCDRLLSKALNRNVNISPLREGFMNGFVFEEYFISESLFAKFISLKFYGMLNTFLKDEYQEI